MILERTAREIYGVQITTRPTVDLDAWEASFDGGTTYHAATIYTDDDDEDWASWLIAGPDATVGSAVAVIEKSTLPKLRLSDVVEIVVRDGPRVTLV